MRPGGRNGVGSFIHPNDAIGINNRVLHAIDLPKIIDISYKDFRLQTPANIEPTRKAAENVIANYPREGSSKVEDYVDTGIIEQLKKEGFVAALQRKYPKEIR